jgi:class 3 adenylate cyclase
MALPCAACGADNREGARFCAACGGSLVLACPECGGPAELGDRFCVACGCPLGAAPAAKVPAPTSSAFEGERKQVTVLFADVKGSMDLAEALDPEDLSRAHLGAGDRAAAQESADEAVAVAHRQGARVIETFALLTRARVRRATGGPPDEVEADLTAALDLARTTGVTAYEQEVEAERRR